MIIWWSNVICLPTIAIIGLACNLLNILILTTHSSARRIPSRDLLLALAICDCLFLVSAIIEVIPSTITPLIASSSFATVYIHSALYARTLASTFYKSSVLLVIIFNLERYIFVCHPLRSLNLYTNCLSRHAILISLTVSLLCSLQWPICYQKYYRLMDYFTLIAFNILPVVIVFILNSRLIITLRQIAHRDMSIRGNFTYVDDNSSDGDRAVANGNAAIVENATLIVDVRRGQSSEVAVAQCFSANAMLFAVVVMLLICVGPQAAARLFSNYYGQYHLVTITYTCVTQQVFQLFFFFITEKSPKICEIAGESAGR
uniref:G-protein coupled receptors family 1 profile domain-containing protein n=1 Tax=Setaria digitata TaxID=48799 RepID=A0A915PMJ5_9BILA